MQNTHVKDVMERDLTVVAPEDTLYEASKRMKDADCGCLPVGSRDNPVGVITDRDIVTRAIADGRDPAEERVRDFMSPVIRFCREEDTLATAADKMHEHRVSRLVVLDESNKMCGILSFGKILRTPADEDEVTEIVACATGRKDGGASTRPLAAY